MNKEQLVLDYINGMVSKDLVRVHKASLKKIQNVLLELGYPYKDARHRSSTYNSKAFSNWDEEDAAYFYGFILGDGCLSEKGNTLSIVIGLNSKDIRILEKLKEYLGSSNKIGSRLASGYNVSQFCFSDKEIINRLIAVGLTSRKSTKEVIPVELENNRHFWRGLVDADGCLSTKNTKAKFAFTVNLVGSKETAEKFKIFSDKNVGSNAKVSLHSKSSKAYYCTVTGQYARKLANFLYKDAKVFLDRKQQIAISIQKDYDYLNTKRSNATPLPTKDGRWTMQIGHKRKTIRLGVFDTQEEAVKARDAFIEEMNRVKSGIYIDPTSKTGGS